MLGDVPQIFRAARDDLLAGGDDPLHARNAVLVAAVASPSVELGESDQADVRDVLDVLAGEGSSGHGTITLKVVVLGEFTALSFVSVTVTL